MPSWKHFCHGRQVASPFATVLALVVFVTLPALSQSAPSTAKRLLGYYTAWSKYNTPPYTADQIPYSKLTHISHAFVLLTPAADGTLYIPGGTIEPPRQIRTVFIFKSPDN